MADNVEHCTRGKGQTPWKQRFRQCDDAGPEQTANRLDHARQRRDAPGAQLRISLAQQRHRDGQSFGRILKPDADGERQTALHTSGSEADPHGKAFGEVVDRDRNDEQPDPPQRRRFGPFASRLEVLVRQLFVHQGDSPHAQKNRNAYDGRRHRAVFEHRLRRIQCRDDQRKERSGEHHTGSEAERQIACGPRRDAPEQHGNCSDCCERSGGKTSEKAEHYWRQIFHGRARLSFGVARKDFRRPVLADEEDIIGLAVVFWPHAGRAIGHPRNSEADGVRALLEKAADVSGRYMAFDHVAINERGVAGDHALRHAVVELEANQRPTEHVLARRRKPVFFEMIHPREATAATVRLADLDRRCLCEDLGRW
ncbi:hypothetical protein SAR116_1005 [Candidatus Puniceispirillum marinum IMCC1322]|uniref:Uncharacterized protein n=1 Tax=Puniceispirillum marinum (strain IMCC1322) TaxID=488538 RepID=D5BSK2_PUNMI|nr:hypothetical protein SAR116_1005 [Candidatus Puniceispirillum marinum IMCC1322]